MIKIQPYCKTANEGLFSHNGCWDGCWNWVTSGVGYTVAMYRQGKVSLAICSGSECVGSKQSESCNMVSGRSLCGERSYQLRAEVLSDCEGETAVGHNNCTDFFLKGEVYRKINKT